MKHIAKYLAAALSLVALWVQAEDFYAGANLGGSNYKGDAVGELSTDRSGVGLKLYGGYAINPNFSLEAGVVRLGKFSSAAGEVKGGGLFVDAVGIWPVAEKLSVLGRVGVFNGMLDHTLIGHERGTSVKLGAGLQYAIDKNISVRGEWERYRFDALGSKPDTDLYSIGLNYRF